MKYGKIYEFAESKALEFPDFTFFFLGTTSHQTEHLVTRTFKVNILKDGKVVDTIERSTGFGDLRDDESSLLKVGDKFFELNFGAFVNFKTVEMNQLKDNQLIIFQLSNKDLEKRFSK
jgi:hypothetical protein